MSIGEVDYKINNSQLVKYLGVTFDPKLNLDLHIYEITHKATKILGILKRTFLFLNKKTFLLYRSLIRPHLEYANVIWYPKYKYQSISVERVQRRATKLLMETRHKTYTQRLEYLDLSSLWHRRLRGDMIQVFKIINGLDGINCEKFFYLLIIMAQEILIKNYIFNMLEHKVKNVLLVEDLHLFGILSYHNEQNVALM